MSDPKLLDFSAPPEEAITIIFPDGTTTADLPTVDQLSLSALQFLTSSGQEWFELFQTKGLTSEQRKRFEHINNQCIKALLCDQVEESIIDSLDTRQKAAVIVGFMTASPDTALQLQEIAVGGATAKKPISAS